MCFQNSAPAIGPPSAAANSAASVESSDGFAITWNFNQACWQVQFDHVTVAGKTILCRLEDITEQKAAQVGMAFHADMDRGELKALAHLYARHRAEQIVLRANAQ